MLRCRRIRERLHPKCCSASGPAPIVLADALAVSPGLGRASIFSEPAGRRSAVLEDERTFARPHFQHRAGSLPTVAGVPKPGSKKPGHNALGIRRPVGRTGTISAHRSGWESARLLRGQNVNSPGSRMRPAAGRAAIACPECIDLVRRAVDTSRRVALGAIATKPLVFSPKDRRSSPRRDEIGIAQSTSRSRHAAASSSSRCEDGSPVRKATWLSRDPSRSSYTVNVFGLISA